MAAILGVSLSFFACDSDSDSDTKTEYIPVPGPSGMIYLDEVATDEAELRGFLENTDRPKLSIGVSKIASGSALGGTITLNTKLDIPDGKLVYILNGTTLDVAAFDLTVGGILYVGPGAALQADGTGGTVTGPYGRVKVPGDGRVSVLDEGVLLVADELSVDDGIALSQTTALGTDRVSFTEKATLRVLELNSTDAVQKFFDYLTVGELDVTEIKGDVMPSDLADIRGITATKRLTATAAKGEGKDELVIRKGATITTFSTDSLNTKPTTLRVDEGGTLIVHAGGPDTLEKVTRLTVNGTLNVGGTSADFKGLANNGEADGTGKVIMGPGDFGPYALILLKIKNVESAATGITAAPLIVPPGTTLTLISAAVPSAEVLVQGKLVIKGTTEPVGNVTVADGGEIEVIRGDPPSLGTPGTPGKLTVTKDLSLIIENGGAVKIFDESTLVLVGDTSGGAKLTGGGRLVAGATEIVGGNDGWQAYGAASAGHNITIKAGAAGAAATVNTATITATTATTVFKALGAGAKITQLAGAGNKLLVDTATEIALEAGNAAPAVAMGSLILIGHSSDPGEIGLVATTSQVTAEFSSGGSRAGSAAYGNAKRINGLLFQPGTTGQAPIFPDDASNNSGDAPGLFVKMVDGSNTNYGLKGGTDAQSTITINATAQVGPQ
jgi:hypothetical protein